MNSAEYVSARIEELKKSSNLMFAVWQLALLCVGWAYVFGARGEYCDPENRRAYFKTKGDAHHTIKTKCKGFDSGVCSGCKWYPSGKRTRFFDCRGFVYWCVLQIYGFKIMGAGATSQWNTESNWKAKGEIATMPKDTLCCLFVQKGKTMEHVGFGWNNETCECSNGVQHFTERKAKWTHWAVPACCGEPVPVPDPSPTPSTDRPTLKRGSKGGFVQLLQTMLTNNGYSVGSYGIDGDFGKATESAVKAFQKDNGLTADGIVGAKTWLALDGAQPVKKYTVTIPHLTESQAEALLRQYPGTKTEERG